jgi:hypothetical protein
MSAVIVCTTTFRRLIGSAGDAFVMAGWRDAGSLAGPPCLIAPLTLHHRDDEAWYTLEGTLRLEGRLRVQVRYDEVEAGARQWRLRGARYTPYVLESRARSCPLPDCNDPERLSPDRGNPLDARPD